MKFLGNMGISPRTIEFLRALGHEAKRLHEERLDQLPDSDILQKARAEESILLTNDLDFGELAIASPSPLPSIIIFRLRDMRPETVNAYLARILDTHGADLQRGAVISVTEGQIRVRRLPLT
jgi:predicted nuclease of predicted toxin-antitoxin system